MNKSLCSEHSCADSGASSSSGDRTVMDDYLDEALDGDDGDDEFTLKKRDKRSHDAIASVSSSSFSYECRSLEAPSQKPITGDKPMESHTIKTQQTVAMDGKNTEQPAFSVNSYRRQHLHFAQPVARKVLSYTNELDTTTGSEGCDDGTRALDDYKRSQMEMVDAKIRKLSEYAAIQQQQIVQASNALNTCASIFEFSGSTESVVAEWKLLVACKCRLWG